MLLGEMGAANNMGLPGPSSGLEGGAKLKAGEGVTFTRRRLFEDETEAEAEDEDDGTSGFGFSHSGFGTIVTGSCNGGRELEGASVDCDVYGREAPTCTSADEFCSKGDGGSDDNVRGESLRRRAMPVRLLSGLLIRSRAAPRSACVSMVTKS